MDGVVNAYKALQNNVKSVQDGAVKTKDAEIEALTQKLKDAEAKGATDLGKRSTPRRTTRPRV